MRAQESACNTIYNGQCSEVSQTLGDGCGVASRIREHEAAIKRQAPEENSKDRRELWRIQAPRGGLLVEGAGQR